MSYEFKVGQQVVCINIDAACKYGGIGAGWFSDEAPAVNDIYTITEIFTNPVRGNLIFSLAEIKRDERLHKRYGYKCGYGAWRFRPLVSDTQSWLKEILATPPKTRVLSDDNVKNLLAKIFDSVAKPQ